MTPLWTSSDIASACGGSQKGEFTADFVAFDSREVEPGSLFIALKGAQRDGHEFVGQAFTAGAAGVLVSCDVAHPHVRVGDTAAALDALGRAGRGRTDARIVGVTGSVGKTTTKEALFDALDRFAPGRVHRSVKSYNNHTGVPLSLARTPQDCRFGVYELGMNYAGEIAALTRLVRPHVAIVTAVASAHREFFASEEAIADAKAEIFEGLEPEGTAILPFDSVHRDRLIAAARPHAARILTFGFGEGADVRAQYSARESNGGTMISARLPDAQVNFTVAQPGEHMAANALAVLAAVDALGADVAAAGLALAEQASLKGRGQRRRVRLTRGEALLIDESYNANPASMAATLRVLGEERVTGRRIAVLGAMRELGPDSHRFHAELAVPIAAARVDYAILVGEEMEPLADALGNRLELAHVPNTEAATRLVRRLLEPGDAVLVKGSNSIGLAALVEALANGKD